MRVFGKRLQVKSLCGPLQKEVGVTKVGVTKVGVTKGLGVRG